MPILASSDFTADVVQAEVINDSAYIADALVTTYWHNIASDKGVPVENLPASPGVNVKQLLVLAVMTHVASDNIGSVLQQIAEGIVVDQWERRHDIWKSRYNDLLAELDATDVYDSSNPPEDLEFKNSSVIDWGRG